MNGQPLTLAHGAPLRLVVPGWAGDHWAKWLTHVALQQRGGRRFYMQTAYRLPIHPVEPGAAVKPEEIRSLTTFPVKSVIARPTEGSRAPAGPQELAGCAFSGDAPLAKVEVSIDGGKTWRAAALEGEAAHGPLAGLEAPLRRAAGGHLRRGARHRPGGNAQPEKAAWNPSGYFYNAWHSVTWEVA